jgi:hypothetical protein
MVFVVQLSANEVYPLADADNSAKPRAKRKPNGNRWWSRLVAYLKRKAHERKAKKNEEAPEPRSIRLTMWSTVAIAVFTVVLACVSYFQLREIKQAGVESGEQMNQMIEQSRRQAAQLSRQAGETHDLAIAAKAQSDQTKTIAEQAKVQANAAQSAAKTASEALHVSQRAYLVTGKPMLNSRLHYMEIPIQNIGQIPSGDGIGTIHEATLPAVPGERAEEAHWFMKQFLYIARGDSQMYIRVALPAVAEERVNNGTQGLVVAGNISYNDGFDSTPKRDLPFCFHTLFDSKANELQLIVCDPEKAIAKLKKMENYPQNRKPN